jgi:hypothetical protein
LNQRRDEKKGNLVFLVRGEEGKCGLDSQATGVEVRNKMTPLFFPLVLLGKEKEMKIKKRKISAKNSPPE